ncbi:hypothetical protein TWF569_008196 [Orbilia oligospora]|nr:hypothetical protein TWF706_007597 [Orbilia oligospora]KAF3140885.1 hypothetical protein TWF569_008196 [Orbilia oligospora]KAF3152578.1 hypothetical protein TWF594_004251 [Orbilia oligospora]
MKTITHNPLTTGTCTALINLRKSLQKRPRIQSNTAILIRPFDINLNIHLPTATTASSSRTPRAHRPLLYSSRIGAVTNTITGTDRYWNCDDDEGGERGDCEDYG